VRSPAPIPHSAREADRHFATVPRTYIVEAEEAATERTSELTAEGSEIQMVPDVTDRPNFENPDGLAAAIGAALGEV